MVTATIPLESGCVATIKQVKNTVRVRSKLADRQTESSAIERHMGNIDVVGRRLYAEPPPAVGTIEAHKVLQSQINRSLSVALPRIWALLQSRMAAHRATTATWRRKSRKMDPTADS